MAAWIRYRMLITSHAGICQKKTSLLIRVNIFLNLLQKCSYSNLPIREISLILSKNWVAAKTELPIVIKKGDTVVI